MLLRGLRAEELLRGEVGLGLRGGDCWGVLGGFGGELAALVEARGLLLLVVRVQAADDVAFGEVVEVVFGGVGVGVGELFDAGMGHGWRDWVLCSRGYVACHEHLCEMWLNLVDFGSGEV